LQELIAPSIVEFYNIDWQKLGTKHERMDIISHITIIDVGVLGGMDSQCFSIAKRMSWASRRTTTRLEDVAYSLLGLFGVNMPICIVKAERHSSDYKKRLSGTRMTPRSLLGAILTIGTEDFWQKLLQPFATAPSS
jgi:hypothetical protein